MQQPARLLPPCRSVALSRSGLDEPHERFRMPRGLSGSDAPRALAAAPRPGECGEPARRPRGLRPGTVCRGAFLRAQCCVTAAAAAAAAARAYG